MNTAFHRKDALIGLFLGIVTALFLLVISINLHGSLPVLDRVLANRWPVLFLVPLGMVAVTYVSYLGSRGRTSVFQFGKFAIIGVSNTAIDLGILNGLILLSGAETGMTYTVFKAVSFAVGILNSYFWNKIWTFGDMRVFGAGKQFAVFTGVSLVGFLINVGLASFIVNVIPPFGSLPAALWANFGAVVALVVTIMWNFVGYKFIVFKR